MSVAEPEAQHSTTSLITGQTMPEESKGEEDDERTNEDISIEDGTWEPLPRSKSNTRETKKDKNVRCPKCGKGFTSKKRLLQGHYNEETMKCRNETDKQSCPLCGKLFANMLNLRHHYDEDTKTCKNTIKTTGTGGRPSIHNYSDGINNALTAKNISEDELYAVISEVMLQCVL